MEKKILVRISLLIIPLTLFSYSCEEEEEEEIKFSPVTSFADWTPINIEAFDDLYDIYFVDKNLGWIVGENRTLISTASGDLGWTRSPVDHPVENLKGVYFVDELTGWMVGDLDENPVMGQVAYTINGGGFPVQQFTTEYPLNTVTFINESKGWAAGENGIMIHTQNGGKEWEKVTPFTTNDIHDLHFPDPEQGWAVTSAGGMFRTVNGAGWKEIPVEITSDLLAIHFVDSTHGWACGAGNTILRREKTDKEINWTRLTIMEAPTGMIWKDVFFVDTFTGWVIGGGGTVYKTRDGGSTWESEISNVSGNLNAIYMVDSKTGWIAGDDGTLISYSPGE